jgi:hypothetical protein
MPKPKVVDVAALARPYARMPLDASGTAAALMPSRPMNAPKQVQHRTSGAKSRKQQAPHVRLAIQRGPVQTRMPPIFAPAGAPRSGAGGNCECAGCAGKHGDRSERREFSRFAPGQDVTPIDFSPVATVRWQTLLPRPRWAFLLDPFACCESRVAFVVLDPAAGDPGSAERAIAVQKYQAWLRAIAAIAERSDLNVGPSDMREAVRKAAEQWEIVRRSLDDDLALSADERRCLLHSPRLQYEVEVNATSEECTDWLGTCEDLRYGVDPWPTTTVSLPAAWPVHELTGLPHPIACDWDECVRLCGRFPNVLF